MTITSPIIDILYEDERLLAVNKPAGIHSARSPRSVEPCMAEYLCARYPALVSASKSDLDGGLVNRLDRETSGVLLAAKDRAAWELVHEALTGGGSTKEYLALVQGALTEIARADGFIGSEYRRGKKVSTSPHEKPRFLAASTEFLPVRVFERSGVTLVRAIAKTGRRHQIRVHAASIGHPLAGDRLYGAAGELVAVKELNTAAAPPEFFLHASRMTLIHPTNGKELDISAPVPAYAERIV